MQNPKSAIQNPQFVVRLCAFLACAVLLIPLLSAQDEEKIQKLFREAIEAMGGEAYVKVTDTVSEGSYFLFNRDGDSSGLIKFNDYTKFPDKSRNELGNKKKERDVTVFNLEKNQGWIRTSSSISGRERGATCPWNWCRFWIRKTIQSRFTLTV